MGRSKVVFGNEVLVDLTGDSVTESALLSGYTAHDKAGNQITGEVTFSTVHTGNGEPSTSIGVDGDIYIDLG